MSAQITIFIEGNDISGNARLFAGVASGRANAVELMALLQVLPYVERALSQFQNDSGAVDLTQQKPAEKTQDVCAKLFGTGDIAPETEES